MDTVITPEEELFDLDIRTIEQSPDLDKIIYDTGDNCGQTCASACTSCR